MNDSSPETTDDRPDDGPAFRIRRRLGLREKDLDRAREDLRKLVQLRNNLVHHLIDQYDLWSVEGCRSTQVALVEAYGEIDQSFERLKNWAGDMERARQAFEEFVQSPVFHDLVIHGIAPDGTVDWPSSSLVSGFREAARAMAEAEGEWLSVAEAGRWIVKKYPDQTPKRFGCKTWQQALQESKLFDLRRVQKDGRRVVCFKERANPKILNAPERTWEIEGSGALIQRA